MPRKKHRSRNPEEINPGERLAEVLRELYPLDKDRGSFLADIDHDLQAEGELLQLTYDSIVFYLVRRLIVTAEFYKRQVKNQYSDSYTEEILKQELMSHLKFRTEISEQKRQNIVELLLLCLRVRNNTVTQYRKDTIRRRNSAIGTKCYLCGGEIDYDSRIRVRPNPPDDANEDNDLEIPSNLFAVEHKWPNSMGGLNEGENLIPACENCNDQKHDIIDTADHHYEHISLVKPSFNLLQKIAVWSKSEYRCEVCGKEATYVGELKIGRKFPDDGWHFLNLAAYCDKHFPDSDK